MNDFIKLLVDIILSLCTILISVIVFLYSRKANRTAFEINIYQLIQESKINLDSEIRSIINDNKSGMTEAADLNDYLKVAVMPPMETYLNALENACAFYYSKDINRKRFLSMFAQDILNVFKSNVYQNLLKGSKNFLNLKRLHKELTGRGKRNKMSPERKSA
jgi:hypothetical protein